MERGWKEALPGYVVDKVAFQAHRVIKVTMRRTLVTEHIWERERVTLTRQKEGGEWKKMDRSKINRTIYHPSILTYCVYINQLRCSYGSNKDMKCLLYLMTLYIIIHMDTTY